MKPHAQKYYNDDPQYIRSLIEQSGFTQREVARRIGISERTLRKYLAQEYRHPYSIQYAIEQLTKGFIKN